MSELAAAFISELLRSANEIERLTKQERARLLQRAASTIRDYREQTGSCEQPIGDDGDIVKDLNSMAENIDLIAAPEVSMMMLEAIGAIKAGRTLLETQLDAEYEKLIDGMNEKDNS